MEKMTNKYNKTLLSESLAALALRKEWGYVQMKSEKAWKKEK